MSIQSFTEEMKKLGVHVSNVKSMGLLSLKYNKGECTFEDPRTYFCRGLILDATNFQPVCVPPGKSLKFPILITAVQDKWSDVIIEEFVDGTMINVFYFNGDWHISTRSKIGAKCKWYSDKKFSEMFEEAKGGLDFDKLNPELSYSFVLRHPENRIVTEYKNADLVLVEVRKVYQELDTYMVAEELKKSGVEITVPQRYTHTCIEDIQKHIEKMDYQEQGLVFKYGNIRSKIRNQKYNSVKMMRGNDPNLFMNYLKLRKENQVMAYLSYFPEHKEQFASWRDQIHFMTRSLWDNYQRNFITRDRSTKIDRKSIPFEIRTHVQDIHNIYRENKTKEAALKAEGKKPTTKFKVNFDFVKTFFNNLDHERIIWIINFRRNYGDEEGFYASKKADTETATADTETVVAEAVAETSAIVEELVKELVETTITTATEPTP